MCEREKREKRERKEREREEKRKREREREREREKRERERREKERGRGERTTHAATRAHALMVKRAPVRPNVCAFDDPWSNGNPCVRAARAKSELVKSFEAASRSTVKGVCWFKITCRRRPRKTRSCNWKTAR